MQKYSDILQVGARNMQNFTLCASWAMRGRRCCSSAASRRRSRSGCCRAEYILAGGNMNVMLCERGIRTFESYRRNTLDISAIPVVRKFSHLPILVDPSHGTGLRDKVAPWRAPRRRRRDGS